MPKDNEFLTGKWFHSFHKSGEFHWQGQIVSSLKRITKTDYAACDEGYRPKGNYVLVQLYSWLDGVKTDQKVVSIREIHKEKWSFYDTAEEMRHAYYKKARTSQNSIDAQEKFISSLDL